MNAAVIESIHERFQKLYQLDTQKVLWKETYTYRAQEQQSVEDFINQLLESGAELHLAYLKNWLTDEEWEELQQHMHYPVLLLQKTPDGPVPLLIGKAGSILLQYTLDENGNLVSQPFEATPAKGFLRTQDFNYGEEGDRLLVITCFPNKPLLSAATLQEEGKSTFGRLLSLLKSERSEIGYIYIYAIIASIIGLSLPLGVQSIIGFISSGQVTTSVIVLIGFIVLGILVTGGLQVTQLWLVEHIQQRLFTKTAFEFAYRIPKIKIESVLKYYPPELMNRFFDIITLQKGLAKILLEFSSAMLQIILGLILLSLYHSSFIFFGIFLITILALIIRFTGPKGLGTSLKESKYKYMLANWLEEIARSLSTFKLAGYSNLPMEKTDYYVSSYLQARKSHFKILVIQYMSFIGFKTLVTAGLLILGCLLLIEKQINIGQFVASEIIIILIMNAVEKTIIQLDTVYDVLTSIEKIGAVTDLPIEIPKGVDMRYLAHSSGLGIDIRNLSYKYPAEPDYILRDITLHIAPSERVCLTGYSNSGKTTLINIILGFLTSYEGSISFNKISLHDINKNSLIHLIGDNVSQEDLFDGTLMENITLGRHHIHIEDIQWAIECVGLSDFMHSQPHGLQTKLTNGTLGISESVARKIILARSIVTKPKLLILEDFQLGLDKESKLELLSRLMSLEFGNTFIFISNDENIMKQCDKTIILKDGKIVASGAYATIKNDPRFQNLI